MSQATNATYDCDENEWQCNKCTLIQSITNKQCEMCLCPSPIISEPIKRASNQWFIHNMNQFDLTIFKHHNDECDKTSYTKCTAMKRLINALKYYSVLDIINNANDREIFRHFVMEIYRVLNDDYIHFQEYHHDELQQILSDLINKKQFAECRIKECKYTARHHRNTANDIDDVSFDPKLRFYKDMMDTFHFHLFHCLEAGLRTSKAEDDDDEEEEKNSDYFDAAFARMHRMIVKREKKTKTFHRFSTKNSKYNIATATEGKNSNDHHVYCDEILKHLLRINANIERIKELYHLMKTEDYDTDSIKDDESLKPNGNINKTLKNEAFANIYNAFIKNTKLSSQTFAIGFRFYYWLYYKHLQQLDDEFDNDHSGFEVKELFIEPKYVSLKEEIRNNKHISIKQYEEEVIIKVNEYKQSARFKKITATSMSTHFLRYDIKSKDPIRVEHLYALVLYTDYTDLCTEFSATFRRKNVFESINNVIKRNMSYYWMSRYLRECVEVFGQSYYDAHRWDKDYIRGPFYSGISAAMNMNSFNVRLCAPTSTSKQIEVAMKFSGADGMVLQLNTTTAIQHCYLHCFNASWISKYKEEDERLYFGGLWFIKIDSVRIRSTKQNFEKFIFSLWYLDAILTAGSVFGLETDEEDVLVLTHLMNNVSNKNNVITKRFDEYVYSTFAAFVSNKTHIVLELEHLNAAEDNGIRDLVMYNVEEDEEEEQREDKDMTNLFKAEIFEIFKKIRNIIIKTTTRFGDSSYSVSMSSLLALIDGSSVQQIIVKAVSHRGNNWIKETWFLASERLTKSYEERNYQISMEEKNDGWSHWFIINKKT